MRKNRLNLYSSKRLIYLMLVFINIYIMTQVGLLDLAYGHDIKDQKQHQAKQGNEHSLILRSKQYYDVKTSSYITDKDIVISSGIITAIVPRIKSIGNNQTLIDLGDINLFPGLIDMHAHLFLFDQTNNGDFQKALRKSTEMKNPIRLQKFKRRAKSYLSHGFTSVRDLGNSGQFLDVIQRQKEKTNNLFSPRLFVSGQGICTQACQFPIKTPAKEISQEYFHYQNDLSIFKHHKVDLLKVYADNEPSPGGLNLEQLKHLVTYAKKLNIPVSSHCSYDLSAKKSILAGVDSIEHGYQLSDETIALMAKNKTFLVPTDQSLEVLKFINSKAKNPLPNSELSYLVAERRRRLFKAFIAGVPIVGGTDLYNDFQALGSEIGPYALKTLSQYHASGLASKDIIKAFTLNAALLLKEARLGQIKPGAFADIIGVFEDPMSDIRFMEKIKFVMKNGNVFIRKTKK